MKFPNLPEGAEYFVASDGDTPTKMYFDLTSAEASKYLYMDLFNKQGEVIKSYKYVDEDVENDVAEDHWTDQF